jgi:putative ATPase
MTQDLFSQSAASAHQPLAARMRPTSLDDLLGQDHLLGPGAVLRKALQTDHVPSMILYGPAGSGKTTLAMLISQFTRQHFEAVSAVTTGVAELRRIAQEAIERRKLYDQGTVLLVDEIHRLNKGQQDALLPYVERGDLTLVGATTENPYFSVVTPLLSRCRVFTLHPLAPEHLRTIIERARTDREQGLGKLPITLETEALDHLVTVSAGDARVALNALELAVQTTAPDIQGRLRVDVPAVEAAMQQPMLRYDRAGTEHYDTISAYIKSMRGSDPQAAIYYLARMLEAGEDPRFIARRLIIQSAEDIGLADPTALKVAVAAADAVEYVGLPEAQIPLAMATLHLALAPKSNSAYTAIAAARAYLQEQGSQPVSAHLAGGPRPEQSAKQYLYPHDYPGGWVAQTYLPSTVQGEVFYQPGTNEREQSLVERLRLLREATSPQPETEREVPDEDQ